MEEAVKLHAVGEDFLNLMNFKATPAMFGLCITNSL